MILMIIFVKLPQALINFLHGFDWIIPSYSTLLTDLALCEN